MTTLASGSSSAAARLEPVNPSIATILMLSRHVSGRRPPGFEDLVGAAWDHVQESGGAAALLDGRQVQDEGDVFDSVGRLAPYVFIDADDTHAFKPGRVVDQ